MTIWITSDTHFNHRNIVDLQGRPFANVDEMNECMIENWNRTVGKNDEVWHLGDFGMDNKVSKWRLQDIFNSLNGRLNLVLGNHDEHYKDLIRWGWNSVQHYKKIKSDGKRAILCHYPLASWNGQNKWNSDDNKSATIHFHGHCHGTLKSHLPYRDDVGVDVYDYTPQNYEMLWDTVAAYGSA